MKTLSYLACLVVLGISSCTSIPSRPTQAHLAGNYAFQSLGKHEPGQFPNPLIDFSEIAPGSAVRITQNAESLAAHYRSRDGRSITRSLALQELPKQTRWQDGALVTEQRVRISDGFILPGAARQYRGSRIQLDAQGHLHITGTFMEKGMMLFLIPFTDRQAYELVIQKAPAHALSHSSRRT